RGDAVRLRPGQFLFGREAAAVPPALFRGGAATGGVHAGKWFAAILAGRGRQWESDDGGEGGNENDACARPAPEAIPERFSAHGKHAAHAQGLLNRGDQAHYGNREPFWPKEEAPATAGGSRRLHGSGRSCGWLDLFRLSRYPQ